MVGTLALVAYLLASSNDDPHLLEAHRPAFAHYHTVPDIVSPRPPIHSDADSKSSEGRGSRRQNTKSSAKHPRRSRMACGCRTRGHRECCIELRGRSRARLAFPGCVTDGICCDAVFVLGVYTRCAEGLFRGGAKVSKVQCRPCEMGSRFHVVGIWVINAGSVESE